MKFRVCIALFVLLSVPVELLGELPGKIYGRVTSSETGEALIGVNVVLSGTNLGAATDLDGEYRIINVPPGEYRLIASMIGYRSVIIDAIFVRSDLTTVLDINMSTETIEGESVTITAERPIVQKDVTTSMSYISREQIEAMPSTDYNDLLLLTPGMMKDSKGFHLRGGRAREVILEVDGVQVQEPNYGTSFAGNSTLSLNNNAISEIQVQSGGFNAEFGNALSGIVGITTLGGSKEFHLNLDVERELDFDPGKKIPPSKLDTAYYDDSRYDYRTGYKRFRLSAGGPLPVLSKNISYNLSGQFLTADDAYPGRENTDTDLDEKVLNAKLSFPLGGSINVALSGMISDKEYDLYDVRRKYIPETFQRRESAIEHYTVNWNHAITPNLYYTVLSGYSRTYYKAAQPGKWWDITKSEDWNVLSNEVEGDTLNPEAVDIVFVYEPGTQYVIGGDNNLFREEDIRTFLVKSSATWQKGKHHQIKSGFEFTRYDLFYQAVLAYKGFPFTFAHGIGNDDLNLPGLNPTLLGVFLQDKIEFEGLIMNAGLRLDRFEPDATLPSDFRFPYLDPFDMGPDVNDLEYWAGPNNDIPSQNPDHPWKKASVKYTLSPRLGVSHPITDTNVLHFTFGQFYQIPDWYLLYRNYNYSYDILALYGNPDLRPEKTTSFEVGLNSALSRTSVLGFTTFYKDIRDLVETVVVNDLNDPEFQEIAENDSTAIKLPTWFVNKNVAWGTVKGFELSYRSMSTSLVPVGIDLSYTFMIGRGKTSDYHDGFLRSFTRGQLEPVREFYLSWDQRHTLILSLDYRWRELSGINVLTRYGSGYPYTGYQESLLPVENNKRLPYTLNVDLKMNHSFPVGELRANAYLLVVNLLDRQNVINFDNGDNRRIPVIPHLLDHPDEYEGPLDDPVIFGPHREIRFGLSIRY